MKQTNEQRNSRSRKIGVGVGFALATIAVGSAIAVPNIIAYQNRPVSDNTASWAEDSGSLGAGYYSEPTEVSDTTKIFKVTATAVEGHAIQNISLYNLSNDDFTQPIEPSYLKITVEGKEYKQDYDYYIDNGTVVLYDALSSSEKIVVEFGVSGVVNHGDTIVTRMWNNEAPASIGIGMTWDNDSHYNSDSEETLPKTGSLDFSCPVTSAHPIDRFELYTTGQTDPLFTSKYKLLYIYNEGTGTYEYDHNYASESQWKPNSDNTCYVRSQPTSADGTLTFVVQNVQEATGIIKVKAVAYLKEVETQELIYNNNKYISQPISFQKDSQYTYICNVIDGGVASYFGLESKSGSSISFRVNNIQVIRDGQALENEKDRWGQSGIQIFRKTGPLKTGDQLIITLTSDWTFEDVYGEFYYYGDKPYEMKLNTTETSYTYLSNSVEIQPSQSATFYVDTLGAGYIMDTFGVYQYGVGSLFGKYQITSIMKDGKEETLDNDWEVVSDQYHHKTDDTGALYQFTIKNISDDAITATAMCSNNSQKDMVWFKDSNAYISPKAQVVTSSDITFTCNATTNSFNCVGLYYADGEKKGQPVKCTSASMYIESSDNASTDLERMLYKDNSYFAVPNRSEVSSCTPSFNIKLDGSVGAGTRVIAKAWKQKEAYSSYGLGWQWDAGKTYFYNKSSFDNTTEYHISFYISSQGLSLSSLEFSISKPNDPNDLIPDLYIGNVVTGKQYYTPTDVTANWIPDENYKTWRYNGELVPDNYFYITFRLPKLSGNTDCWIIRRNWTN